MNLMRFLFQTPDLLNNNVKYFLGILAINFGVANNSDKNLNSYVIQKYNNNLKINNDNDTYVTHAFLNNFKLTDQR